MSWKIMAVILLFVEWCTVTFSSIKQGFLRPSHTIHSFSESHFDRMLYKPSDFDNIGLTCRPRTNQISQNDQEKKTFRRFTHCHWEWQPHGTDEAVKEWEEGQKMIQLQPKGSVVVLGPYVRPDCGLWTGEDVWALDDCHHGHWEESREKDWA